MALTYRNPGDWGSGKGAPLTSLEADANIHDLDQRLIGLENNPPTAVGIQQISVAGNQMTIALTDASEQGPFTLPSASWNFRGEWQPSTIYAYCDVISQGGSLYFVLRAHTSGASFDPVAQNEDGYLYNLILTAPEQPYDVGMFHASVIPAGGGLLLQHVATRSFVLPIGFTGSTAFLRTPVDTDSIALPIQRNGDQIGQIEFNVGEGIVGTSDGQIGSFVADDPEAEITFARTDRLTVLAPDTGDGVAADLSITFAGRAGSV